MNRHTILLVQPTQSKKSRTFDDYETVNAAMDGVCRLFEQKLKERFPNRRNITYDINDLFGFIDELADLSCLVFNPQVRAYSPYGKDWIKKRVFAHLKRQATAT